MSLSVTQPQGSQHGTRSLITGRFELNLETVPDVHTLRQMLYKRKISQQVIALFQIEPYKNGWRYPTPSAALRWKNYDSDAEPKYTWLDGSDARGVYHAENIAEAIAAADGVCWMVSGEPDVWA